MSFQTFKDQIAEFAKDTKLNLASVLTQEGAPGLTTEQIAIISLATAHATKSAQLVAAIEDHFTAVISPELRTAAQGAASIMAMNNVYYRFLHLVEDPSFSSMPAKLRMNIIAKPGVAKVDFELASLAVSALAGCGKCIQSHVHEVIKAGISKEGIQSAVRIASVIASAAQADWSTMQIG